MASHHGKSVGSPIRQTDQTLNWSMGKCVCPQFDLNFGKSSYQKVIKANKAPEKIQGSEKHEHRKKKYITRYIKIMVPLHQSVTTFGIPVKK